MKNCTLGLFFSAIFVSAIAAPTVANVQAKNAYPWNRVAVSFDVSGIDGTDALEAYGVATNLTGGAV